MILAIAYCHRDIDQALKLLRWIGWLSEKSGRAERCLLVCGRIASKLPINFQITTAAANIFGNDKLLVHIPEKEDERPWPMAANFMFQEALQFAEKLNDDMLWLEPDAIPTRPMWFSELRKEWEELARPAGKKFMGALVPNPRHMSGVAIYGRNWREHAPKLINISNGSAWDVNSSDQVLPLAHFTDKIVHKFGRRRPFTPSLEMVPPGAAIFHQDKKGLLIDLLDMRDYGGMAMRENVNGTMTSAVRFFHTENASRPLKASGMEFVFEPYRFFAGVHKGVLQTDDHVKCVILSILTNSPTSGITEIDQPTYEKHTKRKIPPPPKAVVPTIEKPVQPTKPKIDAELTVVITSHQRPKHLRLAFESCLRAQVKNIIVAATGDIKKMSGVFAAMKRVKPDLMVLEHDSMSSNKSWLLGVEAVSTEYVALLHDDDLLLSDYMAIVSPGIHAGAPFVMVQARNHGVPDYIEKDSETIGLESTSVLRPRLEKKANLAISPIRGVFLKSDLYQWLNECEAMPRSCYLRPGFLVGNDLVIWLKATEKYAEFFNVPKPAVSFGHWEGSTTIVELAKNDGKLFDLYDEARMWHRSKSEPKKTPVHIVTIVLDGMPFIAQHISVFNRLKVPWEWHIVEGAASNTHCTRWCKPQSGRLSQDGTTEYLDQIASHPRVHLYRKSLWDGKVEMVNHPLSIIFEECVLLEVDCDEFWTAGQIEALVKLFDSDKLRTHAMFWCRYFFGPHLVMNSRNCYANNPGQDWKRAWRFFPGDKFISHEPPQLTGERVAFMHADTEAAGLVFDHYGYATRAQVKFKESFYGYKGAVKSWEKLQKVTKTSKLSDYLPWVAASNSGLVEIIA